jgi:hypothetical protein
MFQKLKNKIAYAAVAAPIYAQEKIDIGAPNEFKRLGDLDFPSIVKGAISLIMVVVALAFFFMLIWGGLKWVTSEGDQKAVEAARNQITNALIGLAIVFAAWAIVKLIETVFDVNLLQLVIPSFQR